MAAPIFSLVTLPPEMVVQISSSLSRREQCRLRSVCRQLALTVTPLVFRSVHLHGCGDCPRHFMDMAETKHLRGLVREITFETVGGRSTCGFPRTFIPDPDPEKPKWNFPREFFDSILFLRCFPNLKTLHVRIGQDDHNSYITSMRKPPIFFRAVLETLFHVLAGTWTDEWQQQLQKTWKGAGFVAKRAPSIPPVVPIPITTLTISNIMEYTEPLLTDLDPFKAVLESSSIVDFRLYIATQTYHKQREWGGDVMEVPERYAMFCDLPSTWLSLSVAANLHILSIYCHERWGWLPQLDSEMTGPNGGMPNLKVLSLGRFTFSHESQIDWFSSLDLEELYLHDCAVLHKKSKPMNKSARRIAAAHARGSEIFGYDPWAGSRIPDRDFPGDIRWNTILDRWRESMSNLRVFKAVPEENRLQERRDPFLGYQSSQRANVFRYFKCELPNAFDNRKPTERDFKSQVKNDSPLTYVCYDDIIARAHLDVYMRTRNANLENVDKKSLEKGLLGKDEAALKLFEATVNCRQ